MCVCYKETERASLQGKKQILDFTTEAIFVLSSAEGGNERTKSGHQCCYVPYQTGPWSPTDLAFSPEECADV